MAYNKIRFGRNLQLLRSQREVSQQELADAIHVTRQSISTWERGAGKPDIFCLHDISEYFGVSLEQLMYEKVIEKDVPISYEEPEYIDYVKSFDAAGLYTIIDEDLEEFFPMAAIMSAAVLPALPAARRSPIAFVCPEYNDCPGSRWQPHNPPPLRPYKYPEYTPEHLHGSCRKNRTAAGIFRSPAFDSVSTFPASASSH